MMSLKAPMVGSFQKSGDITDEESWQKKLNKDLRTENNSQMSSMNISFTFKFATRSSYSLDSFI